MILLSVFYALAGIKSCIFAHRLHSFYLYSTCFESCCKYSSAITFILGLDCNYCKASQCWDLNSPPRIQRVRAGRQGFPSFFHRCCSLCCVSASSVTPFIALSDLSIASAGFYSKHIPCNVTVNRPVIM